ncbi:MAG: hypothetical protein K0Q79_2803 [Flavipsychrobacter sp.]|jgi:hypothetical protein|nr:hypothetical protein [Flavipsychrobacter sp.]
MSDVLFKIIAGRFYKINAGFFLLVLLLSFGIMNAKATVQIHYEIMYSITSSSWFLNVALLVCALYNLKCISFALKEIANPANSFVFEIQAADTRKQMKLFFVCHTAIYSPVAAYCMAAAAVGFGNGNYVLPVLLIVWQLAMCVVAALVYIKRVNSTWQLPAFSLPSFKLFRRTDFSFCLMQYSLFNRKGTFIGVKLFSLLLLQAMVSANADKIRMEATCVLIMFSVSAHALLPLYYVQFMERELQFLRNLPLATFRRFAVYGFTYAMIFIPEVLFLLLNVQHSMPIEIVISLYAVAVSQLLLYTAILYLKNMRTDRYTMVVFAMFFITMLFLAAFNLWILFAVQLSIATVLFMRFYNDYEPLIESK